MWIINGRPPGAAETFGIDDNIRTTVALARLLRNCGNSFHELADAHERRPYFPRLEMRGREAQESFPSADDEPSYDAHVHWTRCRRFQVPVSVRQPARSRFLQASFPWIIHGVMKRTGPPVMPLPSSPQPFKIQRIDFISRFCLLRGFSGIVYDFLKFL